MGEKRNRKKMKSCPNCKEESENTFEICWNCQYSFTEKRILQNTEFTETCIYCNARVDPSLEYCPNCNHKIKLNRVTSESSEESEGLKTDCLRCKTPMLYKGPFKFHEGTRIGVMGDLFELFVNREAFDLYFCPKCRKIEFFLPQDD